MAKDGKSERAHLQVLAIRGNPTAIAALEGPPFPDCLEYLWEWVIQLHGRSGATMAGLAPLSYGTVAEFARLNEITVEPHEVEALMLLDGVLLFPKDPEGS